MAEFLFVTEWDLDAPVTVVWDALVAAADYPSWWPYVARTTLVQAGDADGLGSVWRVVWKTAMPYQLVVELRTVCSERPTQFDLESTGDLVGTGHWRLTATGANTHVRYEWHVRTARTFMNVLAPVSHPLFTWNHGRVMESGAKGLAQHLGATARNLSHEQTVRIANRPAGQVSAGLGAVVVLGALVLGRRLTGARRGR